MNHKCSIPNCEYQGIVIHELEKKYYMKKKPKVYLCQIHNRDFYKFMNDEATKHVIEGEQKEIPTGALNSVNNEKEKTDDPWEDVAKARELLESVGNQRPYETKKFPSNRNDENAKEVA